MTLVQILAYNVYLKEASIAASAMAYDRRDRRLQVMYSLLSLVTLLNTYYCVCIGLTRFQIVKVGRVLVLKFLSGKLSLFPITVA